MLEPDLVLPRLIASRAETHPDRTFLEHVDGSSMTYRELHDRAMSWAGACSTLGVSAGQTVAAMLPTSFDAIAAWFGISWLRAIEVPINTGFKGRMLAYIVTNSQADVVIVHEQFVDRFEADEVLEAIDGKTVVLVGGESPAISSRAKAVHQADDVLTPFTPDPDDLPQIHDIATIMYTSGTTGPSKGVLVPWAQAHATATGCFPLREFTEDDAWYSPYPLFHVSGKGPIYAMALVNGRVVLRDVFSTKDYWDDVRRHRCTASLLMGSTTVFLERQPPSPTDTDHPLEKLLVTPLPDDVDSFCKRFGLKVMTCFNMTEISAPIVSTWDLVDSRSCGRVRDGYECRVVDEYDLPVAPGELGELVVRSSEPWTLMAGYWGMPEKTVEAWRNQWFHTGDGFTYDEDGNFYFVDRRKDAIRRRGENISSMEVEAEIHTHPEVLESAVIAVPSEWSEDEVMAFVVRRPGSELSARDLYSYLEPRMARFMLPRFIQFVDALPKTPTSKVRKTELRDHGVTSETWDRDVEFGRRRAS